MNEMILTQIAISLAALLFIKLWGFSAIRRDNFRSDIRALRDELFDFMWENKLQYDSSEYVETRQTLNGMMQISRTMTAGKFFVLCILHGMYDTPEMEKSVSSNPLLSKKVVQIKARAVHRMLTFLFLEGTFGFLAKCVWKARHLLSVVRRVHNWNIKKGNQLLNDFFVLGAVVPSLPAMPTKKQMVLR
jgi:hypothetical protein